MKKYLLNNNFEIIDSNQNKISYIDDKQKIKTNKNYSKKKIKNIYENVLKNRMNTKIVTFFFKDIIEKNKKLSKCGPAIRKIDKHIFKIYTEQLGNTTCSLNAIKNVFNITSSNRYNQFISDIRNNICDINGLDYKTLLEILNYHNSNINIIYKMHFIKHGENPVIINSNPKLKIILKHLYKILKKDWNTLFLFINSIGMGHYVTVFRFNKAIIFVDTQIGEISFYVYKMDPSISNNKYKDKLITNETFLNDEKFYIPIKTNFFEIENLPEMHYLTKWGDFRLGYIISCVREVPVEKQRYKRRRIRELKLKKKRLQKERYLKLKKKRLQKERELKLKKKRLQKERELKLKEQELQKERELKLKEQELQERERRIREEIDRQIEQGEQKESYSHPSAIEYLKSL